MGICMGIFGVGADVLLDHRREGRLAQVPVTVDARIDQQVHVMRVASSVAEAIAGRLDR